MSDLIETRGWRDGTRDRIMALISPPSQDVYLSVHDARWIKDEIERLIESNQNLHRWITKSDDRIEKLEIDIMKKIASLLISQKKHELAIASIEKLEAALAALEKADE